MKTIFKFLFKVFLLPFFTEVGHLTSEIFRDKFGRYAVREIVTFLATVLAAICFGMETVYSMEVNPFYFLGFMALAAIGKIGYSLERIMSNPVRPPHKIVFEGLPGFGGLEKRPVEFSPIDEPNSFVHDLDPFCPACGKPYGPNLEEEQSSEQAPLTPLNLEPDPA